MVVEKIVPHGMCAGVRAAVDMAMRHPGAYCLHGVVHSEIVTDDLKSRGCRFVEDIEDVPDGAVVVFSAHGVAPAVRARASEKGLAIVDATCPHVARSHRAVREFQERGLCVVVLGDPSHQEVKGLMGEIDDRRAPARDERIGVVCQTSLDYEDAKRMVAELRRDYVVEGVIEPCAASRERQAAVRAFSGDALLVLGSRSSANTRRLCEVAKCTALVASNMEEVESASASLKKLGRVGVTSGASTPESFFDSAVKLLEAIGCSNF